MSGGCASGREWMNELDRLKRANKAASWGSIVRGEAVQNAPAGNPSRQRG